jgi:hypothetical protein
MRTARRSLRVAGTGVGFEKAEPPEASIAGLHVHVFARDPISMR